MDKISISEPSDLAQSKQEIVHEVVQGLSYDGSEKGYRWWWQVNTMDGENYRISEEMKEAIFTSNARFFTMPKGQMIAAHQIKSITKETSAFGDRPGGA